MDRPVTLKADFPPELNQPLAVPWLMLAVPPKLLAVSWLLFRNSQLAYKLLESNQIPPEEPNITASEKIDRRKQPVSASSHASYARAATLSCCDPK